VNARKILPDRGNELSKMKMKGDNAEDSANEETENNLAGIRC
jgi:hypothetical protein